MRAFVLMLEDGEEEIFDRILLALNGEETVCRSSPDVKCSKLDFRDCTKPPRSGLVQYRTVCFLKKAEPAYGAARISLQEFKSLCEYNTNGYVKDLMKKFQPFPISVSI